MNDPVTIRDIDLSPVTGKSYFSIDREWREEFIYFLMVDRFQDDVVRPVAAGPNRSAGKERRALQYALETDWLAGAAGFEPANPSASYLTGIPWQLCLK
jgi:hypothetical protein